MDAWRRIPASRWLTCAVSLLLLVRSSLQEDVYFVTQPEPYYYSYLDRFIVIPCQAIRVDEAGEQTPIDATPFRNGERLVTDGLPARHQLTRRTGAVDGVLVGGTKLEDVGSRYWCAVEREGEVLAVTRETHILVGDGRPLPVRGVDQLDQGLYSVSLEWDEAPVPSDSPVESYELTVLPQDRGSAMFVVEVSLNSTSVELAPLEPGSSYLVAVAAVNSNGVGNLSEYRSIMTLAPEVPRPPTHVRVEAVVGSTSTSLIISWTPSPVDPEVMTPLTSYIIYYGLEPLGEELSLSEVVPVIDGGVVSGYTVTGVTLGGEVRVGVAAVNSAGASQVVYHQQAVGVGCSVLSAPEHGAVSQNGIGTDSVVDYSCEQGFTLIGNKTRVCTEKGLWTGHPPTCKSVGCSVLSAPEHGAVSQNGIGTDLVVDYSCEQGFTLTGNKTRVCTEKGLWTGHPPTCKETSSGKIAFLLIIIISLAVVVGLVVVIAVVCILIFVLRRKHVRMGREGRAVATFKNASPSLKQHQPKPQSAGGGGGVSNNGFEDTQIGLSVLRYNEEPRAVGTPPPPDPTTFQQATPPSPPSSNLPPSYSNLEETLRPNSGEGGGFPNQISSNCSPPAGHSIDGEAASCRESRQSNKMPLSVSYSNEPRTAGSTPSPHPPTNEREDSTDRSEANSTTRILD